MRRQVAERPTQVDKNCGLSRRRATSSCLVSLLSSIPPSHFVSHAAFSTPLVVRKRKSAANGRESEKHFDMTDTASSVLPRHSVGKWRAAK